MGISQRQNVLAVWLLTTLQSPRLFPVSITSSILCTLSVHSFTGMLVKVWKRVNSPRRVRILQLLRKNTKDLIFSVLFLVWRLCSIVFGYSINDCVCICRSENFVVKLAQVSDIAYF